MDREFHEGNIRSFKKQLEFAVVHSRGLLCLGPTPACPLAFADSAASARIDVSSTREKRRMQTTFRQANQFSRFFHLILCPSEPRFAQRRATASGFPLRRSLRCSCCFLVASPGFPFGPNFVLPVVRWVLRSCFFFFPVSRAGVAVSSAPFPPAQAMDFGTETVVVPRRLLGARSVGACDVPDLRPGWVPEREVPDVCSICSRPALQWSTLHFPVWNLQK